MTIDLAALRDLADRATPAPGKDVADFMRAQFEYQASLFSNPEAARALLDRLIAAEAVCTALKAENGSFSDWEEGWLKALAAYDHTIASQMPSVTP